MGVDLIPIGNHKIKFKRRSFKKLVPEILERLNKIEFANSEFLRLYSLKSAWRVRTVRKIKTKNEWTCRDEEENYWFKKYRSIDFEGPFDLSLSFNADYIFFFEPPLRYWQWIKCDDFAFRNEWRKYLYQVIHAFEGDRVIYLADSAHPLCEFAYLNVSFEEIESALKEKFGESKKTYEELAESIDSSYMIDYLQDIAWDNNLPLDEFYPEPDDLTSIDYNLREFETFEQLIEIGKDEWDDILLRHKIVNEEIHFVHIVRYGGVIIEQYGIVGGMEKRKSYLDKYAPFTFDTLEEKAEKEYCDDLENSYSIIYKSEHEDAWADTIEAFENTLPWTGNGVIGGGTFGGEERKHWFYAVN